MDLILAIKRGFSKLIPSVLKCMNSRLAVKYYFVLRYTVKERKHSLIFGRACNLNDTLQKVLFCKKLAPGGSVLGLKMFFQS